MTQYYVEMLQDIRNQTPNIRLSGEGAIVSSNPANAISTPVHGRTEEYEKQLRHANATGTCPFCQIDRSRNPVDLMVGKRWRAWKCEPSYDFHARHIVLPHLEHKLYAITLGTEDIRDLYEVTRGIIRRFDIRKFVFVMRSGDPAFTGSTLRHLHAHIQEPNGLGPAFAVFHQATSKAQAEMLRPWFVETFQGKRCEPEYHTISDQEDRQFWSPCRQCDDEFVRIFQQHVTRASPFEDNYGFDVFAEIMKIWKETIAKLALPGSSLVIHEFPSLITTARIIVPSGNGPVIEMFKTALDKAQAEWQFGSFLRMAEKRDDAAKAAAAAAK